MGLNNGIHKAFLHEKASFNGLSNERLVFYMTTVKRLSKLKLDKFITSSNFMQDLGSDNL